MTRPARSRSPGRSRLRGIAMRLALVGVGFLLSAGLLALVEGLLGLTGVERVRHDPFAGFSSLVPVFEAATHADGTRVYRTADVRGLPHVEEFLAEKPAAEFRAFVVGGSSASGVPYPATQAFSAWLERRLRAELPEVKVEIVNAAVPGYASRRVLGVVREIARYRPDLLIVYSGHNEIAERRYYQHLLDMDPRLFQVRARLARTRLYGLVSRALGRDGVPDVEFDDADNIRDMFAVADARMAGRAYASAQERAWGEIHYRHNLEEMIRVMRTAGARTLLVTLGQNLSDWAPGASSHREDLAVPDLQRWEAAFEEGLRRSADGACAEALEAWDRALAVDDRHAELHFRIAGCRRRIGDWAPALWHYRRASDLDRVPHGAPTRLNAILAEVAAQEDALLVDGEAALMAASEHSLMGDALFVDLVHPNLRANQILAAAIAERLRAEGIPRPSSQWRDGAWTDPPVGQVLGADPTLRQYERLVRAAACLLARRDECASGELDAVLAEVPDHPWALRMRKILKGRSGRTG